MSTILERSLRKLWLSRPHHKYTACAGCGEIKHCTAKRKPTFLCIECFDERGGK